MATEQGPNLIITIPAAADLSAKQYYFVKFSGGQAALCSAATDVPAGVLQNKPDAAGKPAEVLVFGISKVVADASLSQGNLIGTSADGQADAKTPGTDTTEYVVGVVRSPDSGAGAAGDVFSAMINCMTPHRAA